MRHYSPQDLAKAVAGGGVQWNLNKMNPTPSDVHVNGPLTNISVAYAQSQSSFIADTIFPTIPVSKQSDLYFTYPKGDFNRNSMRQRAPSTESAGDHYRMGQEPYFAPVYALHKDIADEVRANQDQPLNVDADTTRFLTSKALIFREVLWADTYFNFTAAGASPWGFEVEGVAAAPVAGQALQWDLATSTPIVDVTNWKREMRQNTGFEPNTLVLGREVYDALKNHPEFIDRIKYGQTPGSPAMVTTQAMAQLFEVDRVLVLNAIQNIAPESTDPESADHQFIGGKSALLMHVAPTPGLMIPSAGYTFEWTGLIGAGAGGRVSRMRMDPIRSDRVEYETSFAHKDVAPDLGFLFFNAVA